MSEKPEKKKKGVTKKELEEKIELLEKKLQEKEKMYLRAMADYDNLRKRMDSDVESRALREKMKIIKDILAVIDSFEHAILHLESIEGCDEVKEGVKSIYDQMLSLLKKNGVEKIEVKEGDKFDPSHSEAVGFKEDNTLEDGSVAKVFQSGFFMGGKLLRPAKVLVVKNE